jgi:hypothetical protein
MPISRNAHNRLKEAAMDVVRLPSHQAVNILNEETAQEDQKHSIADQYISDVLGGQLTESFTEEEVDIYLKEAIGYIFELSNQLRSMINEGSEGSEGSEDKKKIKPGDHHQVNMTPKEQEMFAQWLKYKYLNLKR